MGERVYAVHATRPEEVGSVEVIFQRRADGPRLRDQPLHRPPRRRRVRHRVRDRRAGQPPPVAWYRDGQLQDQRAPAPARSTRRAMVRGRRTLAGTTPPPPLRSIRTDSKAACCRAEESMPNIDGDRAVDASFTRIRYRWVGSGRHDLGGHDAKRDHHVRARHSCRPGAVPCGAWPRDEPSWLPVACAGCGQRWYGIDRAHCSTCHRTFTEVDLFDRHRVENGCRSPASVGMIKDPHVGCLAATSVSRQTPSRRLIYTAMAPKNRS